MRFFLSGRNAGGAEREEGFTDSFEAGVGPACREGRRRYINIYIGTYFEKVQQEGDAVKSRGKGEKGD